ncbi:MAG: restriction endonuclease subunit S [Deltaproteobacteria bacterium]|nr:restriction endonuclease subunit S [Deltaproteobacteria bacterium]
MGLYYKYLYYFLLGNVDVLNNLGTGATFKELSSTKLKDLELPLPSFPEQKRIVTILDETFAALETVVANTEKNLANARELFAGYLNSVFASNIDTWNQKKLGDVCENLDSKRVPITKSKRKPGKVPYYGASGIVDYVQDYLFDEDLLLVSEDGANLLARTYPIAFSISGKSWVNNHAHVLRFRNFESQKFIEYYLNSISLAPHVSGMAQPKLNQKALNSIAIPFPSIEIQSEIVEELDHLSVQTKELRRIYQQKLSVLVELKQSLLQKAFSGELTANPDAPIKEAAA